MSKLEMFAKASGYGLAFHGPVLIQLWQEGTPDQGAMKAVEAAEALSRQQHTKVGSLIIVTEHASLPSPRARSILADLPSRLGRASGVALVREGEGFRSAAVRAVMTGIMMFSREPVPHQIFASIDDAIAWLCGLVDASPGPLAESLATLRAEFT